MAKFDEKDLIKLTKLCRIECSSEEKAKLLQSLQQILTYFEQLSEIETQAVPPCNHVLETVFNVMRDDEIGELLPRDLFLSNAPSHVGGMVRVPPIIKFNH